MEFSANISKLLGIILSLRRKGLLTKPGMTDAELVEFKEFFNNLPLNESKESLVLFLLLNSELPFKVSYFTSDKDEEENLSQFICISPQLSFEITLEIISKLNLNFPLLLATKKCSISEIHCIFYEFKDSIKDVELLCEIFEFFTHKVHDVLVFRKGQIDDNDVDSYYGRSLIVNTWKAILDRLMVHMDDKLIFIKVPIGKAITKVFSTAFELLKKFLQFTNGHTLESNPMSWFIRIIRNGLSQIRTKMTPEFWKYLSYVHLEDEPKISAQEIVGEAIYYFFDFLSTRYDEEVEMLDVEFLNKFKIYPKRRLVRLMELEKFNLKTWSEALSLYLEPCIIMGPGYKELKQTNPFKCEKFIDFGLECIEEVDEFVKEIPLHCMRELNVIEEPHMELKIKKLFFKVLALWNNIEKFDQHNFIRTFYVTYPKLEGKFKVLPDSAEMDDFNEKLTKTFNQISSEKSINMNEFLCLCIQSKERTLTALCRSALSDANRLDFYADLIEGMKCCFLTRDPAFEDSSPTLLERELEKMLVDEYSEKETLVFDSFLEKLVSRELIEWTFFKKILSLFHGHLVSGEYEKALCFLSCLNTAWNLVPMQDFNLVFIMYMAQALERLSWDLETFSTVRCQATEIVSKIIMEIPGCVSEIEDTDLKCLKWALENISCYSEITQSYFVKFWNRLDIDWCPPSSTFSTFVLHLIHSGPKKRIVASIGERCLNDVNESLALSLAMVLPRLPPSLWDELYMNLVTFYEDSYDVDGRSEALELYSSFLYLLTLILNGNRKIFPCYRYCVTNFGRIFQRAISESPKVNFQQVVKSAVFFLQAIADYDLRENCSMIFLPVFTDFVNGCSQSKISDLVKVLGVNKVEEVIRNIEKS